jgi:dimethylaniline monooxygenase (N-oxide forming)
MAEPLGKSVCVIGAGIAGLVTAKVLLEDGFRVVVFEKEAELGGVWTAARTYPGLRANNPRETYAFSDHPYPAEADDFPSAEQIRVYLESYAARFRLRGTIHFCSEVTEVSRESNPGGEIGFRVLVRRVESVSPEAWQFDFVAVCNGVFSQPRLPQIDNQAGFGGRIVHSSQLTYEDLVGAKRVVVVGAGKSALDCAGGAAQHGKSCVLLFRSPHWMLPRYFFGRIRAEWMLHTRFIEAFLPYHRPKRVEAVLHRFGRPIVRLWWIGLCRLVRSLLRMPTVLVPESRLPAGFEGIGIGGEFYDALRQGKVEPKQGRLVSFRESAIELDSGEAIDADLVIFATGWRQGVSFLAPDLHRLIEANGYFRLYRHILPPEERRLGFIGYASSTACQLSSEIAAHWLSQCFRGELSLPSVAEMESEITAMERQISSVLYPAAATTQTGPRGFFIGPYLAHYIDDLLRDMGLRTIRTSNFLAEYFAPLWPSRYRTLAEERRCVRAGRRSVLDGFYVSGLQALAVLAALLVLWLLW